MAAIIAKGQRWISEPEPELGVGVCVEILPSRVSLLFPASGVLRQYARQSAPITRVEFRPGDSIKTHAGETVQVESVTAGPDGVLVYHGGGREVPETDLSDTLSFSKPEERLFIGQVDENAVFDLRHEALRRRHRIRQSPVRGLVGGRIELIEHQLFVAHEVAGRVLPRVLLADEVGLGKTIEACLIAHRLYRSGRVQRLLILVPEPLVHQWFIELMRRFNLRPAIFDEERCAAIEANQPEQNPFLDDQLILCPVGLLSQHENRARQAAEAGWDLVIVDEAHHLAWSPEKPSAEYAAVEAVAGRTSGLILLTATPEQLGLESHFARLRLLDPDRYDRFEDFLAERETYRETAALAAKVLDGKRLTAAEKQRLGGEEVDALLDRHGVGRVMFRNTRAAMTGFPKRELDLAPLAAEGNEFAAKVDWLVELLRTLGDAKILLIGHAQELVLRIEAALRERVNAKVAVFHEGLTLLQRDRNAAYFAEPDGARLLLCSEIGSEGRNFQFAHHLVLFDLPLNPELLEQRIGRLDRIGQAETIRIHVPYAKGTASETLARWYDEGLDAFSRPMEAGAQVAAAFARKLGEHVSGKALEKLIADTQRLHAELRRKLEEGQDRLLQMTSCRRDEARRLVEAVASVDRDTGLEKFMTAIFDHFGVHVEELSERTFLALPAQLTTAVFPELPEAGLTLTCDRRRALAREDISFLSWDHPIVMGGIDLLLGTEQGNSAYAIWEAPGEQAIFLESIYVLEPIAPTSLHADRFMPPMPIRVLVDTKTEDATGTVEIEPAELREGNIFQLLDNARIKRKLLPAMLSRAGELAAARAEAIRAQATQEMNALLGREIARLEELRKVNASVRDEEITALREQKSELERHLAAAEPRLDAVRLIWRTPA